MSNKSLFKSFPGGRLPKADAVNEAGGRAFQFPAKHQLAQYAATGCLNSTYYASAQMQLDTVLKLCAAIEPEFIARAALYARSRGHMKDLPALLCAVLATRSPGLFAEVFDRVIDNGKMLRNVVQIIRSGATGRKSLGTLPKRMVRNWLESRSDEAVFRASVGNDPSMADVIRMVHPKPANPAREALYGYLLGREHDAAALPALVRQFEAFKAGETLDVPDVPFQFLTSLPLSTREWIQIAKNSPWQATRMNLNTFARHGVFADAGATEVIAARLRDPEQIARARVFPYQLMVAFTNAGPDVPRVVRDAMQDAMEIAIANVPLYPGKVYVFPDISGSMHSPVTGVRKGSTTAVRCVDVAALVAAAVLRQNPDAEVIPFESDVRTADLNPRDTVLTNAQKLASMPAGGTNCSAPLAHLNRRKASGDLVIYVSDNESWVDSIGYGRWGGSSTDTMKQWAEFKGRNRRAKMVCIDIQPYGTTQAAEREDILNVGGFSDEVFNVIGAFVDATLDPAHWVGVIESVSL